MLCLYSERVAMVPQHQHECVKICDVAGGILMEYETAASCASALLHSWISRFGLPEHITSDRGSAFISGLWSSLANLLGVQLHYTTAYHPQSNGMVERYHRTLKASLMARCANPDWIYHLPWVLLGIRTTPKEGLHVSAAEMVYGQALVVPGNCCADHRAACEEFLDTAIVRVM